MKIATLPLTKRKKGKKLTDSERAADTLYAEYLLYSNAAVSLVGSTLPNLPPPNKRPYGDVTDTRSKAVPSLRYLVMEHLPFSFPPMAVNINQLSCAVMDALQALHGLNLVHCDVKPDNFLMRSMSEVNLIVSGKSCDAGQRRGAERR